MARQRRNRGSKRRAWADALEGAEANGLEVTDTMGPRARACRTKVKHQGLMNKTEARYARHLELLQAAGEIASFTYEVIKIRYGINWKASYKPDFFVVLPDGLIELHEVKGRSNSKESVEGAFWTQASRVRIKAAAAIFPAVFVGVVENAAGRWVRSEEFSADELGEEQ